MTVGFDSGQLPLTTPGNGARSYARAARSVASGAAASASASSQSDSQAQSTRITSTRVGLNLGKFQIDYTSHEMTVDLAEAVRGALNGNGSSFADELDVAQAMQSTQGAQTTRTAAPSSDAAPTATPRRAAMAYAKAQGLDTPAAAMYSLGEI